MRNNLKNFVFLLLGCTCLSATTPRLSYKQELGNVLQGISDGLRDAKHEIRNHEAEIRSFEEKLTNQDTTIESLREQMEFETKALKDNIQKEIEQNVTLKIASLELTTKGLIADCRQLKDHLNKAVQSIQTQGEKIVELQKMIEKQNENISNLESALQSIMEAFQLRGEGERRGAGGISKVYKVKSGDSLEKIAKENNTSVQSIKEINHLSSDRILVGQKLVLP